MPSDRTYKLQDGAPATLLGLCRAEPEWAASRLDHLRVACADLRAQLARAEAERDEAREWARLWRGWYIERHLDIPDDAEYDPLPWEGPTDAE